MRCIRYTRFGGPEVLELHEAPLPQPAAGQVRLRVAGCGLNPIDYKTRSGLGWAAQALGSDFRFVPGYDVAGVVDAVGEGVTGVQVGDVLCGLVNAPLPGGGYAEYCVAPAQDLVAAPAVLSPAHAAGLPLAGLTAWQALFDAGQLQPGERVLVLAGAGGVGHLATQLAKWKGARVSATASAANRDFLLQHGVDQPLDYQQTGWEQTGGAKPGWEQAGPWDLILDLMGGAVGLQALDGLASGGRLVTVPTNTAAQITRRGAELGKTVLGVLVRPQREALQQLVALVQSGRLNLHVSATFPLEQAAAAHRQLETGRTRGKLVLVP